MAETYKQTLTKKQLAEGRIPQNHVLLEMTYTTEGIKSKGGVIIGVGRDLEYEDETTTHAADLTEIWGIVAKLPDELYYKRDDPNSMPWDCDMELQVGDIVWFNTIESRNAVEIVCEGKLYKIIPWQDCYCAKRGKEVIMLNGYVLCEQVYTYNDSPLALKNETEDKTRGIVRYIGKCNREYQNQNYIDFQDLRVGDEVLYNPNTPLFKLERTTALSTFNGNKLYNVVQRRRIAMVLKRES
jgi:hypothetical protein